MSAEQQETLGQMKMSSEKLLGMISDLLELTALKRGEIAAKVAEADPRELLRDAASQVKGRRDGVLLELIEPAHAPVMLTDRRTVVRALRAVLDNAFKFTHAGSVRASVEVAGQRVVYSVTDTGIGIPPDALRSVFEEFRQVDGTMTREYGGAGLGLALARRLARLLHGDITVESAAGAGSTFRLELPLRFEEP